jgi:hypothetical protein
MDALVLEPNRGVVVDLGLRGFVPLSQLVSIGPSDVRERGIPEPVKVLVQPAGARDPADPRRISSSMSVSPTALCIARITWWQRYVNDLRPVRPWMPPSRA